MNSKPQPNASMSTTELTKLMRSADPGTATLASSSFEKKVNDLWDAIEAKERTNAKRRRDKTVSTVVEVLGFFFASASAFCWFWSAILINPAFAAHWNSAAALCAVVATLMLMFLRGKSNMTAKAEEAVHEAIEAAMLYQKQKQFDLEAQLTKLKTRLINLEANKDPSIK